MKALKSENAKRMLADPAARVTVRQFLVAKPFDPAENTRQRVELKLKSGGQEYTLKVVPKPA